jgi:hypothetical protein
MRELGRDLGLGDEVKHLIRQGRRPEHLTIAALQPVIFRRRASSEDGDVAVRRGKLSLSG